MLPVLYLPMIYEGGLKPTDRLPVLYLPMIYEGGLNQKYLYNHQG